MQPPPRKGGYLKVLKHLHSEQVSKLHAKNQQECELLEDIRSFTKQRSAIERIYAESLLKLATTYQNRKIACVPDIRLEDGSEAWNVYSVWRTVLDETEKLGKCRLAGVEVFQQHISEDAKQTRHNKITMGKKLTDQLAVCQKELHAQVQELDRLKKIYVDEESVAMDAREKASAAEEKLKRKKGSIFQSITSLQKNSAKFASKREMCDEKSVGARNDYVLALTATNAHQRRYYEIDFERVLRTMECDMYDKVAEYLTLLARTELLTCSATQVSYTKIKEQSQTITRGYNLRCYLTFYPMLGQNVQYDFDPSDEDKIGRITIFDDNHREMLDEESRKLVTRVTKEVKVIRDCCRRIQKLQAGGKPDDGAAVGDPEARIEELRQIIRRSETEKMKAEAKLEALKDGGVEVEDYSKSVDSESLGVDLDTTLSRSGSSLSVKDDVEASAGYEDERVESSNAVLERQTTQGSVQQAEAQQEPFAAWGDDPVNVDWGDDEEDAAAVAADTATPYDESSGVESSAPYTDTTTATKGVKCVALYSYTSQNPDELTFQEDEELELISEGDGDGWVSARNYKGEVGFIPQNYIEVIEDSSAAAVAPAAPAPAAVDGAQPMTAWEMEQAAADPSYSPATFDIQQPSVDDAEVTQEEDDGPPPPSELPPELPPPDLPPPPPPTSIAINGVNGAPTAAPKLDIAADAPNTQGLTDYCVALYDYEATCHEELTFEEGEVIRILARAVHDVDDGWWMGEVRGQQGLFPSLVVEECGQDGEPLSDDFSGASPCTTPPPHTPPEVPGFLLPPEGIIITQPTPEIEKAETMEEAIKRKQASEDQEKTDQERTQDDGDKSAQYQRQFSSSPDSERQRQQVAEDGESSGADAVAGGADAASENYAELVSSPDATAHDVDDAPPKLSSPPSAEAPAEEIVVTAATPVAADPAAAGDADADQDSSGGNHSDIEGEAVLLDDDDHPPPPPPAPSGGGGSGVEERRREEEIAERVDMKRSGAAAARKVKGGSIELSTENNGSSPTPKSPTPSDGPPDLDLDKLKALDKLKESDA